MLLLLESVRLGAKQADPAPEWAISLSRYNLPKTGLGNLILASGQLYPGFPVLLGRPLCAHLGTSQSITMPPF